MITPATNTLRHGTGSAVSGRGSRSFIAGPMHLWITRSGAHSREGRRGPFSSPVPLRYARGSARRRSSAARDERRRHPCRLAVEIARMF